MKQKLLVAMTAVIGMTMPLMAADKTDAEIRQEKEARDYEARFDLHGRPSPADYVEMKSEASMRLKKIKKVANSSNNSIPSYPESEGGDKSYEYISSFTVTPKDGYYKITVKVICPQLYDEEGYPGYGGKLEYVNVWIDWNGDYSWSDSERVMAKSSANYKKILADNKILYFEATVKDASTASGTFKARAMLGWGYNPSDPATYSWTWGDVMDVPVAFDRKPPQVYGVLITPEVSNVKTKQLSASRAKGLTEDGFTINTKEPINAIAGIDNTVDVFVAVREQDRNKEGFNYAVTITDEYSEKVIAKKARIEKDSIGTVTIDDVKYNVYKVSNNGKSIKWKPDMVSDPKRYGDENHIVLKVDCNDPGIDVCQIPQRIPFRMFFQSNKKTADPFDIHPIDKNGKLKKDKNGNLVTEKNKAKVPMWYKIWKDGNVISELGDFEYDEKLPNDVAGRTYPRSEWPELSQIEGSEGTVTWTHVYKIGPSATNTSIKCYTLSPTFTESKLDYPIEMVARTVCHEKWHGKLNSENNVAIVCKKEEVVSGKKVSQFYVKKKGDDDGNLEKGADDKWCWVNGDNLVNSREDEIKSFHDKRDTFSLETKVDSSYASYGDQEYYCRWASDVISSEYRKKDWSYPGAQFQAQQSATKKTPLMTVKNGVAALTAIKVPSSATYSSGPLSDGMVQMVFVDESPVKYYGTPDVAFTSFADITDDIGAKGLVFSVGLAHNMVGELSFCAYLFGTNGIPIASACTVDVIDEGTTEVKFVFSPDTLAQSCEFYKGPFVLGRVVCESPQNTLASVYSAKNVLETKDYSAAVYDVSEPIVSDSMSDYADGEGLHVVIPVTVPSAGRYTISAYLATTNGMNLVNATTNCVCVEGKDSIDVCFPKDGVFNTKTSGRFLVRDVSVTPEGGEPSLFVCDYETNPYNYSTFDSGNKAIVILPDTIELSVSKDEDPNALHKGIAMRFTVKNKSSSDYSLYRVSAILADANGYNVAYAEEDFILNGESSNVLFFPAQDIRESGKDGPYSVKSIRITDRVTGELIDGCAVSAAKTSALTSTDFKGALTIDEDAIAVTPVAASSDKSKYAGFHLAVPINSPSSGYATLSAIVESEGGASVGRFEDEIEVAAGDNKLTLKLAGAKFLESKANGPYVIRAISVSHSSNPDAVVEAGKEVQTGEYAYTQFVDESMPDIAYYIVKFNKNASDATGTMAAQTFTGGEAQPLNANAFTRTGYTFAGWATSAGGEVVYADKSSLTVSENTMLYAKWNLKTYTVAFDANGGSGTMAAQTFTHDVAQGLSLNAFTRKHYKFTGWATSPNGTVVYSDGQSITVTANATLYAAWARDIRTLWPKSGGSSASASFAQALAFTSYLLSSDVGEVVGTMTVKAQKERDGVAKATVTIQAAGGKKQTIKGTISAADGTGQGALAGLTFTASGVTGTLNGYSVDGAIDASKSKDAVTVAVLDAFKGKSYVMALEPEKATGENAAMANGVAGLSVVFSMKGKAKVTGTMPDGTKVSVSSQLIVGSEWCCLPVVYSKAGSSLAFLLWFDRAGNFDSVSGMTTWKGKGLEVKWSDEVAVSKVGNLSGTSYFHLADTPAEIGGAEVISELLPVDVAITPAGAKWNIAKAKVVKLDRSGNLSYGANPSGLKLTYTAKTGLFKGSLSLYTMNKGRLKKNSVTISGIVVNGIGYGTATMRNVGCWPIVINGEAAKAAEFTARITGVAVVDERSYDVASVTFVPPETALDVPYGKMAVFRTEYDFPAGYSTYIWVRESGSAAENVGSSGSYFNRGTGVAYNFIMFREGGKTCTLNSVRLEISPQPEVAGTDGSWDLGTTAVNLTFKEKE